MDASLENHKAEGVLKVFKKLLGDTQNWTPESVQRKLNIKSTNIIQSKQRSIRGFDSLIEELSFTNVLENGDSFIACIQTKNLTARSTDRQQDIAQFLEVDYQDHFIWCVCRSHPNSERFQALDYSEDMVEVPDLNFGSDRQNQLAAKCPITDVMVVLLVEEKYQISILYDKNCIKTTKHRDLRLMKPIIPQYFKTKNPPNNNTERNKINKENVDPNMPSTSGLKSQSRSKSRCSNSVFPNSSRPKDLHSGTTGRSVEQPFLDMSSSQTDPSQIADSINSSLRVQTQTAKSKNSIQTASKQNANSKHSSQTAPSQVEKETDRKESSDEYDSDDNNSKKIVFKNQYAEITSNGITQKIQIASEKDYPSLVSQVGFQIEIVGF